MLFLVLWYSWPQKFGATSTRLLRILTESNSTMTTSNPVLVSGCIISGARNFIHYCYGSGIKYCYFYHSWDFVPYKYHIEKIQVLQTPDNSCHKLCLETKVEYLILNQDLVFYNTGIRNNAHHLLVSHT